MAVVAGCADPAPDGTNADGRDGAQVTNLPATFLAPIAVMSGDPSLFMGAAGEPNLAVAPDGTRYVGVLGCMEGQSHGVEQAAACRHGLVYRSGDGVAWDMLNQGDDHRLGDGPYANGDTTVAATSDAVHVVLLASGSMHYHRSMDEGQTWTYDGVIGEGDRPWLAASPGGRLVSSWVHNNAVVVRVSDDQGETWMPGGVDEAVARQGRVVWGPACACFLMPLFVVDGGNGVLEFDTELVNVRVAVFRSADGIVWEPAAEFDPYPIGLSGMLTNDFAFGLPAVGQSQDGRTAVAWSSGVGPEPGVRTAARMYVSEGHNATSWGPVTDVTPQESAVLPALAGGRDLVLAYYSSPVPGDPERVGIWSMTAHFLEGDVVAVVEEGVHHGGICGRGNFCNGVGADRSMFDFFEASMLPDGRVALAYTADPATEGKATQIHYAEQAPA